MNLNHKPWWDEPERPIDPPDTRAGYHVDGRLVCCECEEVIPGGEDYFEFKGDYYCESCANSHRSIAPYRFE